MSMNPNRTSFDTNKNTTFFIRYRIALQPRFFALLFIAFFDQ